MATGEQGLRLVSLEVSRGNHSGRVFLSPSAATRDLAAFAAKIEPSFVEDDDVERLKLIEQALGEEPIVVQTFPGCSEPQELHAYVIAPSVAKEPLFACVLASTEVVEKLVVAAPHFVVETATFQFVGPTYTGEAIVTALQAWAARVLLRDGVQFLLQPWEGDAGNAEVIEADALWASVSVSEALSPLPDLVPDEFKSGAAA